MRCDSGFYADKFLQWFEQRKLNYIVAVKFYENFKYKVGSISQWSRITKGLDIAELYFKPDSTKHTRRYIIVKKKYKTIQTAAVNFSLKNRPTDTTLMSAI